MDQWTAEAMNLAKTRAPTLDDEHAADLADDLYRAWFGFGWSPAKAVAWFFAFMPRDWEPQPATRGA